MSALEKQYPDSNAGVTAAVMAFDEYLFHDTRASAAVVVRRGRVWCC